MSPSPMMPSRKLTEEDVVKLRTEKTALNRHSRRMTGMKQVCRGKAEGSLECETSEGQCPDFKECHPD